MRKPVFRVFYKVLHKPVCKLKTRNFGFKKKRDCTINVADQLWGYGADQLFLHIYKKHVLS